ncbi:MAG: hypothetical protein PHR35_09225 [Kiritimatiellae bacterium]|nr:hypothetical protein [Kiritimatiellia bacterium]
MAGEAIPTTTIFPARLLDVTMFVDDDDGSPARFDIPEDLDLNLRVRSLCGS